MSYRIIIIDDEKEISDGFSRFFPWEKLGFTVVGKFSDGVQALEYLKEFPVDVVVSDVLMPRMTGVDLARELSQMTLSPRPIMLLFSAYDEFKYVRQAVQYGCGDYILKSTDYEELIEIFTGIKNKLDVARAEDRLREKETGAGKDKIISTIQEYVQKNPTQVSLEDAANLVYLSASYVSRYFKQKTGVSFMDYVMEQRMEYAAGLLEDLQYKIYDISAMLGYANPFNFTRSFKKFYGVSPRDYRYSKLGRVREDDEEDKL